jgi:hypothetical protein
METIYSNVESLVEIDFQKTAKFLLDYLEEDKFERIIDSLEAKPKVLYKLLSGILLKESKKSHKRDPSTGSIDLQSLSVREQRKQIIITDPKLQERLIELMCDFEPNSVQKTLQILEDYRPEIILVVSLDSMFL